MNAPSSRNEELPRIQDYSVLADGYDAQRYETATDRVNERARRRALEALLPAYAKHALDVACGTGRGALILRERARHVVGVDGTFEMLRYARQKSGLHGVSYCRANGARLPFPDGAFDLVTCLNFLHLFPDLRDKSSFVVEIARVVKPGGVAVFEFDNALHGLILGPSRKYLGKDIGYDWPWAIRACFREPVFERVTCLGANLPFVWRIPGLRTVERAAFVFPFKYLANRLFVRAIRSEAETCA